MAFQRHLKTAALILLASGLYCLAGEAVAPSPSIEGIEPDSSSLAGGDLVIIRGTDFAVAAKAGVKVTFDSVEALKVDVVSAQEIHAVTPPLAEKGEKVVQVINPDGQSGSFQQFRYGQTEDGIAALLKRRMKGMWAFIKTDSSRISYVLLVFSVIAMAWTIHCLLVIRQSQVLPEKLKTMLLRLIAKNELAAAEDLCEQNPCVLSRVLHSGLRKAGRSSQLAREAIQAAGVREAAQLQQKISYLSNIGVIAPMLGLLGTMWGMILAFRVSVGTLEGIGQTPALMAAVSTAMNTTALGLIVGIPAMSFYFFLRGRTVKLVTELEVVAEEAIHELEHRGGGK